MPWNRFVIASFKKHFHWSSPKHWMLNLRFQFPKFRLVKCFLPRPMYRALNEKSCWLIKMNIRKALQASAFTFIVLNLVKKVVLDFPLIILNYIKESSPKKATDNFSFQFHYGKFSQKWYSALSYYYKHVTRERRRGRSPLHFLENWKSDFGFAKKCPDCGHLWVTFLI